VEAIVMLVGSFKTSPTFAIQFFAVLLLLKATTFLGLVQGSPFGVVPGTGDNALVLNNTGFFIAYKLMPGVLGAPVTVGGVLHTPFPPLSKLVVVAIGLDMS